ncbi:MAG: NAD+ synthase [Burkholderiaceae bacterium]|jgi:NAD+ synthase (glutamine-hydrolysing)|nr:NAD+ synthase [Burkholderiaceae bacterium]
MNLKICAAQLDLTVGDAAGNARRIIDAARQAHAQGARLLLTPELSICGGPAAEDLFLRPAFIAACGAAVQTVARETANLEGMVIAVGHPASHGERRYAAASVICHGQVIATCAKRGLSVDERRYFAPGQGGCVFQAGGVHVGLLIGGDACLDEPAQAGAQMLAVMDAWPFYASADHERELARRAQACGLPLVCANLAGGQDEAVFAGRSLAVSASGQIAGRAPAFEENLFYIQTQQGMCAIELEATLSPQQEPDAHLWSALVLALRGYVRKNGFKDVILGLSGGIDSALVLALAVDALGKDHVRALMLPSPYTAGISLHDARDMARRLGVRYDELPIQPQFESFKSALAALLEGRPEDATEENLQARTRGVLLMALSNKFGALLLTTGNKSEYATGYCTLYGDTCGGFAPLKDVLKTTVFRLARWRNAHDPFGTGANPIAERVITRPPSAELRPGQTDQDSLPPYEVLDAIIAHHMENGADSAELLAAGFARADVEKVLRLIRASEYKRRQSAPGPIITRCGFGKDWRYPLTHGFRG